MRDSPLLQRIGRVGLVDAHRQEVFGLIGRVYGETVGAGPAEHGAHHAALVLARLAVQRHHDVGTAGEGIAHAVGLTHLKEAVLQRLLIDVGFGPPCAVLVAHPRVATAHRQETAGILQQRDRFLLLVAYHAPGLYHVAVVVSTVAHIHHQVIGLVLHADGVKLGVGPGRLFVPDIDQFCTHVAVSVPYAEGIGIAASAGKGRVGRLP